MSAGLDVNTLRELFRNLQLWQAASEDHGVDTITHEGVTYHLQDIEYLYQESQKRLPRQQRRAIELCLYEGMRERDAALEMQVSPSNPVAMYASEGIKKLLKWVEEGKLPRYRPGGEE